MGKAEAEHAARVVGRMWNGHDEVWVIAVVVDVDVVIDRDRSSFAVKSSLVIRESTSSLT